MNLRTWFWSTEVDLALAKQKKKKKRTRWDADGIIYSLLNMEWKVTVHVTASSSI